MTVRILFASHTGACSGAEHAMLRLLEGLPADHARAVACPPGGRLEAILQERGVEQFDIRGLDVSMALHPVRTPLGFADLLRSAVSLRFICRAFRADVVHANTVRAGLIALATRRLGGPPVVVQCHDHLPRTRTGDLIRGVISREADVVVAVTDCTAGHFNRGLRRPKAQRVYISVDHSRFSPAVRAVSTIRSELGLPDSARLLAQVAQITPWKGQDTAIRALQQVREHFDAHLLVVGDVAFDSQRFDNLGYRRSLESLVRTLDVESAVHFLGYRDDVPELIGATELLLLPSWDEPFGLVVAEAMAVGTPVLVTQSGGPAEYVSDGVSGRLLPPREPEAWATAAIELLGDPATLERMRAESVRAVAQFTDERYSAEMLEAYVRAASS